MFVIGLTGGIGSGKTKASEILNSLGAKTINADTFGHCVYKKNTKAWGEIIEEFGQAILDKDGNIVRSKLANRVFASKSELDKLNHICHPEIKKLVIGELDKFRTDEVKIAVVEAAILIEANWQDIVNEVWSIESKTSIIFNRVEKRDNINHSAIQSRIDSQIDNATRIKYSDIVITNNGTIEELKKNLSGIWKRKFISHNHNKE
tara:strand:- start:2173 stop:2787 length:615 start_codon:yes stop_codon:yes gene_type:complete